MSDSQELKITIIASNKTAEAFDDVVTGADKVKEAVDKIDGSGAKRLTDDLAPLPDKFDDVRTAADDASKAVDEFGKPIRQEGESHEAYVKRLKDAIDDLKTSAENTVVPLDDVTGSMEDGTPAADNMLKPMEDLTTSFGNFGSVIQDVGKVLPGTIGDIVEGAGKLTDKAGTVGTVLEAVSSGAIKVATTIGPLGMGAALGAVGISALYLTGVLGGPSGLEGKLDDIRTSSDAAASSINAVAFSMDNAATGFELFQTSAGLDKTIDNLTRLYEITSVFQGDNAAGDFASGAVEGIESYNEAGAEARRIAAELGITWTNSKGDLESLESQILATTEQQDRFNTIMEHSGPGANAARERLAELNAQYASGAITLEEYNWQVQWITENLVTHYDAVAAAAAVQRQFAEAAFSAAENVGLLDTALEVMNAAGLNTDATMVALNLSTSALDGTFNTIIGTTNRLAAGSQAVADWADSLTNTEDGMSELGEAYEQGRISLAEYSAGMSAATNIQEDNAEIQEEIQAIQAKHLPLMADLTDQQREYIEGLGDLSAEQQIAALGFMDTAKSAQVMELAQLAAKAASGELGDTGEATATKIIQAAANADPVMKQMLLDMGLISEGADGTVTVNFPNSTSLTTSVDNLTLSIDALTIALGGIPPNVNTNITATDNASSVISTVKTALSLLDGQTSTVYINTIGGGLTLGEGGALHGGVLGKYASGGVVAEMGEAGPELFRVPNGTWNLAPTHSLYNVPTGTSVLPAPATRDIIDKARGGARGTVYNGPVYQVISLQESRFSRRSHDLARSRR